MADGGFNVKIGRPTAQAPGADAPYAEREAWSAAFVEWFIDLTGGEMKEEDDPVGAPLGRRWRCEYFFCIEDPAAYEAQVAEQVAEALAR